MICFAIFLALTGLFLFKRRHWRHAYGHHRGGCGRGPRRGHWREPWEHGPGHGGPEDVIDRLNLTKEQDTVVRAEVRKIVDQVSGLRDEGDKTRGDLARAMRGDGLDEVVLGEMFARHDERLEAVRGQVVTAIGRIHAVLEPGQRERLADVIESGLRRGFGPYRV